MKLIIAFFMMLFGVIVLAQAPSPAAVAVVAPASSGLFSAGTIAGVVSLVLSLNIALSAVQQIFAKWAKAEPSWLQSVSSLVLKVAQYIGSNPSL